MISATVLAKNSARTIEKTLKSLAFVDEVLVIDTGSTDQTMEIAREFPNVKLFELPFKGFGMTHNEASQLASNEWILSIDSDEVVPEALAKEIQEMDLLNPKSVFAIKRKNIYRGKWIWFCGWWPDEQVKLYHRQTTHYSEALVHEAIITRGVKTYQLNNPLIHTPYADTEGFLHKMQLYSTLFAKERSEGKQRERSKRVSPFTAVGHALFAFFKSYVLKRGFCGGWEGFLISIYNANTAFYKYVKLWEKQSPLEK